MNKECPNCKKTIDASADHWFCPDCSANQCPVCSWPNERFKTMQLKSGLWKEIRDAMQERDAIRRDIQSVKDAAKREAIASLERMTFWERLRFLFRPVSVRE